MKQFIFKNILYPVARIYWRILKPVTKGVRGLIISEGKILLVQHVNNSYWSLPGGGIGKREDEYMGLLRELEEELQIKPEHVVSSEKLGIYTNNTEGKKDTIVILILQTTAFGPSPQYELQNAEWFPFGNLPENTSSATKRRITEYLSNKRNIYTEW